MGALVSTLGELIDGVVERKQAATNTFHQFGQGLSSWRSSSVSWPTAFPIVLEADWLVVNQRFVALRSSRDLMVDVA